MKKKYAPASLSEADRKKQKQNIKNSKQAYEKGKYIDRPQLKSAEAKESKYTKQIEKKFGEGNTSKEDIARILSKGNKARKKELMNGFDEIFDKGKGAYYSSGSRPNTSAHQWGYARVFSVLLGGPSRNIDKKIVDKYNIPKIGS